MRQKKEKREERKINEVSILVTKQVMKERNRTRSTVNKTKQTQNEIGESTTLPSTSELEG